jgi:quinol monooxygenase YgiN
MALRFGVLALVEAKPGNENDVAKFLDGARNIAVNEPDTRTWYAFRVNDNTFGIFDTFETEEGRQAHLGGAIPAMLAENGPALLAKDPDIRLIDILAVK